jgi:UTP--glucose-1-phosphate uridylyltransferase
MSVLLTFVALSCAVSDVGGNHGEQIEHDELHADVLEHHDAHDEPAQQSARPWAQALGAAATVNLVTLVGVVTFAIPTAKGGKSPGQTLVYASGFAGGALLSAVFLLMLVESLVLINSHYLETAGSGPHAEHEEERHSDLISTDAVWRWGAMVMTGFSIVLVLDLALTTLTGRAPHDQQPDAGDSQARVAHNPTPPLEVSVETDGGVMTTPAFADAAAKTHDVEAKAGGEDDWAARPRARDAHRVMAAILLGDMMHNLADGVFIGSAFLTCDPSVGWAVVVGTVGHELSQEIADFVLLTRVCGLRAPLALALNFASGSVVFLGIVLVFATEVSQGAVGMLLACGAGLFLYNATVECIPRVLHTPGLREKLVALALFVLGAVAVGLVLLDHQHCEAGSHAADHDVHERLLR